MKYLDIIIYIEDDMKLTEHLGLDQETRKLAANQWANTVRYTIRSFEPSLSPKFRIDNDRAGRVEVMGTLSDKAKASKGVKQFEKDVQDLVELAVGLADGAMVQFAKERI
jgi:hypothetical protein